MKIVFDCGMHGPARPWGIDDLETGIGGSETQVLQMAWHLAQLGNDVRVICNCETGQHFDCDVQMSFGGCFEQVPVRDSRSCFAKTPDVVIGWRHFELLWERRAPLQILSCHDIPVPPHFPGSAWNTCLTNVDYVWTLNNYHDKLYRDACFLSTGKELKTLVHRIGIDVNMFRQEMHKIDIVPRDENRCIYFSHPNRGLHQLRHMWPKIHEAVPNATLHAFWWEPEHHLPPVPEIGIAPMRSLGQAEQAQELLMADFFTYPSVFGAEISPATCVMAQVGGAIPVVVCGSPGMDEMIRYGLKTDMGHYAEALISAMTTQRKSMNAIRLNMVVDATTRYAWKSVAYQFYQKLKLLLC